MNRIKEIRLTQGMTQEEFAYDLDIPVKTIRNWEQEQRKCPKYLIKLIEYRFGMQ